MKNISESELEVMQAVWKLKECTSMKVLCAICLQVSKKTIN